MKKVLIISTLLSTGCFFPNSCVARGTRIATPRGDRRIEDLEVGDEVFSVDEETGERVATKITAIKCARREVGCLHFGDHRLHLTTDHPVYCPEDDLYAPAGDWFLGRRVSLLRVFEHATKVVSPTRVETFVDVADVFDITVESDLHNFVADGFLVHNKSPPVERCTIDGTEYYDGEDCQCGATAGRADCLSDPPGCVCPDLDLGAEDTGSGNEDVPSPGDMSAPRQRGDCVTDDDCAPQTGRCLSIPADEPGGHHTCQADLVAEPGCATIEPPDACCVHADCTDDDAGGTCVVGPIFYCGGLPPALANVCLYDECTTDADCGVDRFCLPARVFGEPVSRCIVGDCGTDADCTGGSGGECHLFRDPCNGRVHGFLCTYDDSECRTDADCPDDPNTAGTEYCAPGPNGDGDTSCATFSPPP